MRNIPEPEPVTMRDIYELSEKINSKMDEFTQGCSNCKVEFTKLEGRVETLEESMGEKRSNRRSWRDYVVNGMFVIFSSLVAFLLGRGG